MKITIAKDQNELGRKAGQTAAELIRISIAEKGYANIILATGASQFETLHQLINEPVEWSKVTMFHLDEYIGLPVTARASFIKYLQERFLVNVPPLKAIYLIDGENDAAAECEKLNDIIKDHPIDVALVGIGENGHLAFNDPPADFDTEEPFIIVDLDKKCREQQLAEGWFDSLEGVPRQAISMSIQQIMKSKHIICSVPGSRKAATVKDCLENPVSNLYPASILRLHSDCNYFFDKESSAMVSPEVIETIEGI